MLDRYVRLFWVSSFVFAFSCDCIFIDFLWILYINQAKDLTFKSNDLRFITASYNSFVLIIRLSHISKRYQFPLVFMLKSLKLIYCDLTKPIHPFLFTNLLKSTVLFLTESPNKIHWTRLIKFVELSIFPSFQLEIHKKNWFNQPKYLISKQN